MTSSSLPSSELRVLSLGDSYTIGEAVQESERWPVRLAALLRNRGLRIDDPVIIARTGWTTDELSRAIDDARPVGPFDVVTLLIGVNNQYRGRSSAEYQTEFRALLERAVAFAGGSAAHVVVLSIPDWGVTPFADGRDRASIGAEIDAFNDVNRDDAMRVGARYVDITPISRLASTEPALVASDGLHPSGEMYSRWADLAFPIFLEIVQAGRS